MTEPGVVWVTDEVPDVNGTGGAVRQYHLLAEVAARVPVDLVMAGHHLPDDVASWVRSIEWVAPAPPGPPDSRWRTATRSLPDPAPEDVRGGRPNRDLLRPLVQSRGPATTVVVQHAWLAALVRDRRPGEAWVLDLHNVASAKAAHAKGTAATAAGRMWGRAEVAKSRWAERRVVRAYDDVVVPSEADSASLRDRLNVHVVPNGVDPWRYRPAPVGRDPIVVFTGHLHYPPNVDAIGWFTREVWPRVRAARPGAGLDLVGFAPAPEIRGLDRWHGIQVHADVPETIPYLRQARLAVVPVRIGSGTRLKALEAAACARPVVGTTVGLEGLRMVDGQHALVRDDPEAMAAAIVDVLEDDELAEELGRAARALVRDHFDWRDLAAAFADRVVPSEA